MPIRVLSVRSADDPRRHLSSQITWRAWQLSFFSLIVASSWYFVHQRLSNLSSIVPTAAVHRPTLIAADRTTTVAVSDSSSSTPRTPAVFVVPVRTATLEAQTNPVLYENRTDPWPLLEEVPTASTAATPNISLSEARNLPPLPKLPTLPSGGGLERTDIKSPRPAFPYQPLRPEEAGDGSWLPDEPFLDAHVHRELLRSKPCNVNRSEGHWRMHRLRFRNRVVVCDGASQGGSTIECMLDSPNGIPVRAAKGVRAGLIDPVVRFCVIHNAWAPRAAASMRQKCMGAPTDDCAWRAFCSPVGWWQKQGGGTRATMWRGVGVGYFNWFVQKMVKILPPSAVPSKPQRLAQPGSARNLDGPLHYLSAGDCGGNWNPGHCLADPLNFALVRGLLGKNRSVSTAYLMRGFNYGNEAASEPMYPIWEALAASVIPQPRAYSTSSDRPVPGQVVLAPAPFTNNWWSFENCRARHVQPVVASFRAKVGAFLDWRATLDWSEDFFERSSARHNLDGPVRLTQLDGLILIASRGGSRPMRNERHLFDRLKAAFPERRIAMVEFSHTIPWLQQYAVWRRAQVIVGIHGGNLGSALFLSPGQALVEGVFGGMCDDPTMFAHATVANGALYRCALISNCPNNNCMTKGGTVDVNEAVQKIKELALLLPDPFKIDDRERTTYHEGKW